MLKTLIIDESRGFRSRLSTVLQRKLSIEVVGSEFSDERGLERLSKGDVELVLLNLGPGEGSGIGFLQAWKQLPPSRPLVLVMSSNFGESAPEVLDALSLGAGGFLAKPESGVTGVLEGLCAELERLSIGGHVAPGSSPVRALGAERNTPAPVMTAAGELVAIVSSTGGPEALQILLGGLNNSFTTPIAIVQHLPPGFAASLAKNLSRRCGRNVQVATNGLRLDPDIVVLAPDHAHLEVVREGAGLGCALIDGPREHGCKPSGNRLVRSACRVTRAKMTGVCLTGMGADGAEGFRELADARGPVIVQDEATSVVWGMPAAVLEAGVRATILPISIIADTLNRKSSKAAA